MGIIMNFVNKLKPMGVTLLGVPWRLCFERMRLSFRHIWSNILLSAALFWMLIHNCLINEIKTYKATRKIISQKMHNCQMQINWKHRVTYLESAFGERDLDLDAERWPFLSLDFLEGDRLDSERRSDLRDGDRERDLERLRSLLARAPDAQNCSCGFNYIHYTKSIETNNCNYLDNNCNC